MAVFNASGQSAAAIINNVTGRLIAHHRALADLTAAPLSMASADANAILAAVADAHAEYLIHTTGQAPGSYPQVTGTPYNYSASGARAERARGRVDPTVQFLLNQAPTAALALIGLVMFATGKLHSSAELDRAVADLDTERKAHNETRAALAIASARADAGVRAAELVASAVEGARRVPQAPQPQRRRDER